MRKGRRRTEFLQETGHGLAPFALFETIAAQLPPNPLVHALEFKPACRKAVAGEPSNQKQVEFDDHLHEANAPVSTGNLPDLLLRASYAPGRDPELTVQQQPMAEELAFPNRSDGALFTVHPELEFVLQKPSHRFHHPLPRRQRPHVDIAVSSPGESHPEALSEPYLNLSAHTAPAVEPRRTPICQCANNFESRREMRAIQCVARRK